MRLNLGAGLSLYDDPEWVNVEKTPWPGTEPRVMIYDLEQMPWPWADGSIAEVRANHVCEHLRDRMAFLEEVWRVCAHGAPVQIGAPNCINNPNYWEDPTHRTAWHPGNLEYFYPTHSFAYYTPARFITVEANHTAELLEWKLLAYKQEDAAMLGMQVDWRKSAWDGKEPVSA